MVKRCGTTRRITSWPPICSATKIHRSAEEKVRKIDVSRSFCDATRRIFIALQFGQQEVNLGIIMHLFVCIIFGTSNIQILNWDGIFGYLPVFLRLHNAGTLWAIKNLNIRRTKKWCIRKTYKIKRRFTSRSLNCVAIIFRHVASQNVRKTSIFHTFSTALRWIFVALQIGDREVILRVVTHLYPIHHSLVGSMVKYLTSETGMSDTTGNRMARVPPLHPTKICCIYPKKSSIGTKLESRDHYIVENK